MAQNVDVTITETTVAVEVTLSPEVLAKIEAAEAAASASAAATSASNAATSESNAQTSANNAATSESNAEDSASDSEKHAQSTGPFTDSGGVAFDNGAQGFKNQAEAARDEITGKFTFTDYSDGDLARFDGTKFQPIDQLEASPSSILFPKPDFWEWDPNGSEPNASSGQPYTDIDGFRTVPISPAFGTTFPNGSGLTILLNQIKPTSQGNLSYIRLFATNDTWYELAFASRNVVITESISGVETELYNGFALGNAESKLQHRPMMIYLSTVPPAGGFRYETKIVDMFEFINSGLLPLPTFSTPYTSFGYNSPGLSQGLQSISVKARAVTI